MLDEEADETFVGAEWGAVDAKRKFRGVVTVFVTKVESARLGKIDLVGGDGKFAADRAPGLDVDLRSVKSSLIRHLDEVDSGILEHRSRHLFGLFPKLGLIHKLLAELGRIMRRETH